MAPRKPAAADKAKEPLAVKKSSVVKRPARGFHKFKNGMLNVRPKGDEKALVSSNQNSPLLRLPAELRIKIWEYALGGKEFRLLSGSSRKSSVQPRPSEKKNAFVLLRACRQIYSETAPLSFAVNNFSIRSHWRVSITSLRHFQRYQIHQIKDLRIEVSSPGMLMYFDKLKLGVLSELRRIRFCIFPDRKHKWEKKSFTECENSLREIPLLTTWASSYDLIVEKMEMSFSTFNNNWYAEPQTVGA
ncbi:hypothetical protein HBH56_089250 [Parastagonospora nodorum]|uniref:Uncharacterized protein n=1 Tax=Phaeosphaeria nodorum (strain SN15 / ATCC MYA-4574 / FGSC 10173) TaxID=321614 RepID=A0A7U2I188_PHANO|nr:hypothetical protein HBH56_089250 [Parastagonospora nodorum]QRC98128.1 hypothetical protein JI435_042280 [Parastagonospora nodorum SN15]KAH3936135.1 hypothetical protein HBH54_023890 [Parastagonospora nodorum]KAH3945718.1 hypothetical protein HBH53_140990 [Parastagonospora nodorum]KAH3966361.1 hypothetical protein HBH51_144380 [Parastagonospora nodorum]